MTRNYTIQEAVEYMFQKGWLHYEIEHFGSSRDNPAGVEIAVYQVTLQGSLIATELDRFDYEHIGPPEPFPPVWEVLRDLTNLSVYQYRQQTRDGFTEGVANFVTWIQEYWSGRSIAVLQATGKRYEKTFLTIDQLKEEWDRQHALIDRLEAALGRDVLKFLMEAER